MLCLQLNHKHMTQCGAFPNGHLQTRLFHALCTTDCVCSQCSLMHDCLSNQRLLIGLSWQPLHAKASTAQLINIFCYSVGTWAVFLNTFSTDWSFCSPNTYLYNRIFIIFSPAINDIPMALYNESLRVHSTLDIPTDDGLRQIQLLFGDITALPKSHQVDVLLISAFPGLIQPFYS